MYDFYLKFVRVDTQKMFCSALLLLRETTYLKSWYLAFVYCVLLVYSEKQLNSAKTPCLK